MDKEHIYNVWASTRSPWSTWVKPVLFACMDRLAVNVQPQVIDLIGLLWSPGDTAIVVDLPADRGVWAGIALAGKGYRPVPLYNALPAPVSMTDFYIGTSPESVVDVQSIMSALWTGAEMLDESSLLDEAPPAFLLDANRRGGFVMPTPGRFDNRSISFTTDFPSANFLWSKGIREVVLMQEIGTRPQEDLAHTLLRWQEAGIVIKLKCLSDANPPAPIVIGKPSYFRWIWYRVLVAAGLRRNQLGGFGGLVPFPGGGGG